jgi:hypothetical protein
VLAAIEAAPADSASVPAAERAVAGLAFLSILHPSRRQPAPHISNSSIQNFVFRLIGLSFMSQVRVT